MPRRKRPPVTTRSEHWLRFAVNERGKELGDAIVAAFGWSGDERIEWLSPLADDDYAEYFDQAFLDRLGLSGLRVPLHKFWPAGGPRWDGLARTGRGRVILVEAKAYIEEMVDFGSKASPGPLGRIINALDMTKAASGARAEAPWTSPFYQQANRFAHLHYLAGMNQVDAYLLFLAFSDAPDVPTAATCEQWEGAHRLVWKCLGLGKDAFLGRVAHLIVSVPDMLASRPFQRAADGAGRR